MRFSTASGYACCWSDSLWSSLWKNTASTKLPDRGPIENTRSAVQSTGLRSRKGDDATKRASTVLFRHGAYFMAADIVVAAVVSADSPFEELFAREYPGVVAAAYRVLGDRADGEDVAQEVFARFAGGGSSSASPNPGTLRVAAARRALNLLRSRRRRIERELAEYRLHRSLLEERERSADPFSIILETERRALVRSAMLRISRRDAEILALRYGGATYREIADALLLDPAQVGTRLVRAERAFKREIERASR
jgi:RNA polymerase sigma factor (sigma-70 family)